MIHELIGAEGIGIDDIAPCRVHGSGALVLRADSLAPVVLDRQSSRRPSGRWHLEFPESGHYVRCGFRGVGMDESGPTTYAS